ncbi:MAG: response regulator [Pirellulales bacterium]|nr:response regulator [Pirellulales bacterium]
MFDTPMLLVVDDETAVCAACRRILKRVGFYVHVSRHPRVGLGRAMVENYSAILLDAEMPEMDGFQFLERLRERKPNIPVTVMTGCPSEEDAASAIRLGASDYVAKPFTPAQITQCVHRMLALRDLSGQHTGGQEVKGRRG